MTKSIIYLIRVLLILASIASFLIAIAVLVSPHNIGFDIRITFALLPLLFLGLTVFSFFFPKRFRIDI